jgi:HPt (histidine-containing phosphotransfer) domain-containing protein
MMESVQGSSTNLTAILDRDQLRDITLDDPQLMREVVSMLIDDTSRQIQQLDSAIREHDIPECKRLAHYSKGACANVGAKAAAALFKRIEANASSGDFTGCGDAFTMLKQEIELLRGEAANL